MKFTAAAFFGLAAVASAQAIDCVTKNNQCRQPTNGVSANQAVCASQNSQCKTDCYAAYNTCRSAAGASMASCASSFATCLGESPFASNGTNTVTPSVAAAAAASSTSVSLAPSATANATQVDCYATYNTCRTTRVNGASANMAACAASYASCLGQNPFASNGTNTITPAAPAGAAATVTEVVTSFTTYCPEATTLTYNNKVYTVTASQILTVTDCPCTLVKTVSTASSTSLFEGCNPAHTSCPAASTGAASSSTSLFTGCNPAHTSCPAASTGSMTTSTSLFTGCNPAHTSCPAASTGAASSSTGGAVSSTRTASSTVAIFTGAAPQVAVGGVSAMIMAAIPFFVL